MREGIITSEAVNSLGWAEEVFYRRLHSVVDDFGRYYATPTLLRAACYPLQVDKVGNQDIAKWLTACVRAGLVRAYTIDGKEYLEVTKFNQHVRAKNSKFPSPPDTCTADVAQTHSTRIASAPVVGDGDEGGGGSRKRASRLPPDWLPSEKLKDWAAAERPDLDLDVTIAKFRDYWAAKPGSAGTKLDWDATFRNWVRDEKPGRRQQAATIKVDV